MNLHVLIRAGFGAQLVIIKRGLDIDEDEHRIPDQVTISKFLRKRYTEQPETKNPKPPLAHVFRETAGFDVYRAVSQDFSFLGHHSPGSYAISTQHTTANREAIPDTRH